jgi:hypothetical protein
VTVAESPVRKITPAPPSGVPIATPSGWISLRFDRPSATQR